MGLGRKKKRYRHRQTGQLSMGVRALDVDGDGMPGVGPSRSCPGRLALSCLLIYICAYKTNR